eukprot:871472-Pelagomonas_calceolata.AAC.3
MVIASVQNCRADCFLGLWSALLPAYGHTARPSRNVQLPGALCGLLDGVWQSMLPYREDTNPLQARQQRKK